MQVFESEDVIRLLRSEVQKAGGQKAWAKQAGVDRIVVNRVFNGKRPPSKKIIRALGLRTVHVWEKSATKRANGPRIPNK